MLDYTEIPPAHWQSALIQLRESGSEVVRTRVYWGAHESVRGIRDFSKSSRLRLERFLGMAHSQGLTVELILGFPSRKETFPSWTKTLGECATVPACFWESGHEALAHTTIPSLFNVEVIEGFEAFVEEVVSLCELYQRPEGPVSKVWFDIGAFHSDCQSLENPEFNRFLAKRYSNISALNLIYQTAFRSFESLNLKSSYRVLLDRRPWTAAFDFQWCRREMLDLYTQRLMAKFPRLSPLPALNQLSNSANWELLIDSTFLETDEEGRKVFPCFPGGLIHPTVVQAFRLSEYFSARAQRDKVRLHFSRSFLDTHLEKKILVVISGKYLPRETMIELEKFVSTGGRLFFPFGVPLYDENLSAWKFIGGKKHFLSKNLDQDESVWEKVAATCAAMMGDGSDDTA